MKPIRRILLVLDPSLSRTPAMQRPEALARALETELWRGLFDRGPRLGIWGVLDRAEARRLEALMRDQESARLSELRPSIKERTDLTVRTIDNREGASAECIMERAARHDIDLVIKDVGREPTLGHLEFLPMDRELLRRCPTPVWPVGAGTEELPRRIVAAVDAVHPERGAGALNDTILEFAKKLVSASSGQLLVCSAFAGLPPGLTTLDPSGAAFTLSQEDLYESLRTDHRIALQALLKRQALPAESASALHGPPAHAILEALHQFHGQVLIVGSLQRRGFKRLLLGSAVEHLVGEAPCDVLIQRAWRNPPARRAKPHRCKRESG